jgi:hypothetical protein
MLIDESSSMRASDCLFVATSLLLACESERSKEPEARRAAAAPSASAPAPDDTSFRFPAPERLVAVGDVHGDVAAARAALRLGGAIDDKDEWIGGTMVVVQTGDILDRGDDEPQILDLFEKLKQQAEKAGGAFRALNGNHEVMNVAGDYRYVTDDGFHDFDKTPLTGAPGRHAIQLAPAQQGRGAAFLPGGTIAKRLAERPVIIAVGDSVFVHGGVLPGHVRYGIGRINDETRRWMLGETEHMPNILSGDTAPIWARDYSEGEPSERTCEALTKVLDELRVKRMVVGHTVQKTTITSGCNEKVWRIDVGLAHFYGGRPAVLEIAGDKVRIISGEREASHPSDAGASSDAAVKDAGKGKKAPAGSN